MKYVNDNDDDVDYDNKENNRKLFKAFLKTLKY